MATTKSGFTLNGVDNVMAKFNSFIRDANSKAVPIMRGAADILRYEARSRAPVSKKGLAKGKYTHPPGTLRDSIEVGDVFRTKSGISAAVGIKQNQHFTQAPQNMWYGRWVEFGTRERTVKNWWGHRGLTHTSGVMPATPFMRPALKVSRTKIRNYVRWRIEEELLHGRSGG